MAGTLTLNDANTLIIRKYTISWLSDASGDCTGNTAVLSGTIERINFVPGSGGDQPTDLYTITLKDTENNDILLGYGAAGLSNVNASTIIPTLSNNKIVISEKLAVTVAGAGNANTGTIALYVSRGGS